MSEQQLDFKESFMCFSSETSVREIIQEAITPILKDLQIMAKTVHQHSADVKYLKVTQVSIDTEIINMNKRMQEFNEFRKVLGVFEHQMHAHEVKLKKRHLGFKNSIADIKTRLNEINSSMKNFESMLWVRDDKINGVEDLFLSQKDLTQKIVMKMQQETQQELREMESIVAQVKQDQDKNEQKVNSLQDHFQSQIHENIEKIFLKFKAEEDRYDIVMAKMQDLPKIRNDLAVALKKLIVIEKEKWSHFEESQFVERCIPMLIHLQISEAFQQILANNDEVQKNMLDYENKKVKEIHEYMINAQQKPSNLKVFKQRLTVLYRAYHKEMKGVFPFTLGRDYRPDMPEEEVDYINQAVFIQMQERSNKITKRFAKMNEARVQLDSFLLKKQQTISPESSQKLMNGNLDFKMVQSIKDGLEREIYRTQISVDQKIRDIEKKQVVSIKGNAAVVQNWHIVKKYQFKGMDYIAGKSRKQIQKLSKNLLAFSLESKKEFELLKEEVIRKIMESIKDKSMEIFDLGKIKELIDKTQISQKELDKLKTEIKGEVQKVVDQKVNIVDSKLATQGNKFQQELDSMKQKLDVVTGEKDDLKDRLQSKINEVAIDIQDVREVLKFEYKDFFQNRKKIKADISLDSQKAWLRIDDVERQVAQVDQFMTQLNQAIKFLLEAQFIEHLMQNQDLEDRKSLGVFGVKKNAELVGNNSQCVKVAKQQSPRTKSAIFPTHHSRSKNSTYNESQMASLTQQSQMVTKNSVRNSVFLDKNCMSCSGNSPALLSHVKVACLKYKSNPVFYRNQEYTIEDIASIKEEVLNQCQQLIYDPEDHIKKVIVNNEKQKSRFLNKSFMDDSISHSRQSQVRTANHSQFQHIDFKSQMMREQDRRSSISPKSGKRNQETLTTQPIDIASRQVRTGSVQPNKLSIIENYVNQRHGDDESHKFLSNQPSQMASSYNHYKVGSSGLNNTQTVNNFYIADEKLDHKLQVDLKVTGRNQTAIGGKRQIISFIQRRDKLQEKHNH